MKKYLFLAAFIAAFGFFALGETSEQAEEIDYLLFMPNSSNQFVNESQAGIQLDKLAKYLTGRNLVSGQIHVNGYAAEAKNDIEPVGLSTNRALFVINELQKRGVQKDLFSQPVGYGSVDTWGSNTDEQNRIPNRRVRIMVDDTILTPETIKADDSGSAAADTGAGNTTANEGNSGSENLKAASGFDFPWGILFLLLLLLLIILLIYLLAKHKRDSAGKSTAIAPPAVSAALTSMPPPVEEPDSKNIVKSNEPAAVPEIKSYLIVDLEEEIRRRAYELYLERNDQNGDAKGDWYVAVYEVCARYEASGYETGFWDEHWQAKKPIV